MPALAELRVVLLNALGQATARRLIGLECLKRGVFRLKVETDDGVRPVVAKQMDAATARRNELVMRRWLPAMGLGDAFPALLGVALGAHGRSVWHVYEDLGECRLDGSGSDRRRVGAALELIARLHVRSASHPLLAECRQEGGDRGANYLLSNVRDAERALEALQAPAVVLADEQRALRDRMLGRLRALRDTASERARAIEECGGPEVLVHGDLWTTNAFVATTDHGLEARLIDWDRAAVGPFSYDLSTFLYRFPAVERSWIVDQYQLAVRSAGWRLPAPPELSVLFDTAELARYANCAVWAALAALEGPTDRAHLEELAEVERWFEAQETAGAVLPW